MSYDSSNLTTPDIKWLGVRPSDLDRFNIPEQCRLPMTDEDIKTGKRLVRCLCACRAVCCSWHTVTHHLGRQPQNKKDLLYCDVCFGGQCSRHSRGVICVCCSLASRVVEI